MLARSPSRRPAVTLIESAVIFLVFLTLLLGLFDLGTALFESHVLTDTARQAARQASVHGQLADALGSWAPPPWAPCRPATPRRHALPPAATLPA